MGQVALSGTGHEKLGTGLRCFFQKQDRTGSHVCCTVEAGSTGTDDDGIIYFDGFTFSYFFQIKLQFILYVKREVRATTRIKKKNLCVQRFFRDLLLNFSAARCVLRGFRSLLLPAFSGEGQGSHCDLCGY